MSDLISLKVDDRGVDTTLARLLAKGENMRPVMREISHDMRDAVLENFGQEGRPNPWKKSRRAAKQGGKTLQDQRHLMKSITPDSSADTARVGTNLKYAAIHHFGGPIKHPARDRIMHFRRNTVDLFANEMDANRHLHMPNGQTLHFRRKAGAGFAKANKRAHFAMKVSGKAYSINMPARPYMLLMNADLAKIVQRMKRYLEN